MVGWVSQLVTVKFAIFENARALHGGMWHYGVINTIKEHLWLYVWVSQSVSPSFFSKILTLLRSTCGCMGPSVSQSVRHFFRKCVGARASLSGMIYS